MVEIRNGFFACEVPLNTNYIYFDNGVEKPVDYLLLLPNENLYDNGQWGIYTGNEDKQIHQVPTIRVKDLPYGEYTLGGAKIIYRDIVCRLEDGTVAGSVLPLNKGVWNVYTNSNIPLYECVNGATQNNATVIGCEKTKGSLDVGKDADIIITDAEFNVNKTIIGGTVRYEA
jgi:hypothetical protein